MALYANLGQQFFSNLCLFLCFFFCCLLQFKWIPLLSFSGNNSNDNNIAQSSIFRTRLYNSTRELLLFAIVVFPAQNLSARNNDQQKMNRLSFNLYVNENPDK